MSSFLNFSAYGDPGQARANFVIYVVLAVLALGLVALGERKLAVSCVGMIFMLRRASGKGVPLERVAMADTQPAPKIATTPTDTTARDMPAFNGPVVGVVLCCLLFGMGCGASALDAARIEYGKALKVATATNARFKAQSRDFQEKNIKRIGIHTPGADRWVSEFVVKRQPIEEQIHRCEAVMDEASDLLLLADDKRGVQAATNATACVVTLRDMIAKFFDGGL